jgi:hypothetical protein
MKAFVMITIEAGDVNDVFFHLREISSIQPVSAIEQTLTCLAADM